MEIVFGSRMTNGLLNGAKPKRQKFGIGSLLFLMALGTIFAAGGWFFIKQSQIDPSWKRVAGEVVSASPLTSNGSTTYAPVVKYQVNGQAHQVASGSSGSSYPSIGAGKEVAYDPAHPEHAKVVSGTGDKAFLYFFPAIGLLVLVGAPIGFVRSVRRGRTITELKQTGQRLQGVIIGIQNTSAQNTSGYKVIVAASDVTGQVRNYTSDEITGIGGIAMMDFRSNPIPIDVYIDSTNPQSYYVDISELPNLTPQRIGQLIQEAKGRSQAQNEPLVSQAVAPVPQPEIPAPLTTQPPSGPLPQ